MKVQLYQKKVREGGGVVSARIAMAAARGILLICNRSTLAEYGNQFSGRIQLFIVLIIRLENISCDKFSYFARSTKILFPKLW